ncbi:MAG TPA: APC family permease [Terriglobales bacterium]|nr:APC family permease [Terriglobales bacterium]
MGSTPIDAPTASSTKSPPRVMGFADLLMFYVVTGISLRWLATAAHAGPSSIVIWIGTWLCFYVPLALSVVELASRYPQEGGLYVWSKQAFGDFAGYIAAWTYWTSNLPYFPAILYFAASNVLYMRGQKWMYLSDRPSYYVWFSLLALALITLMHYVGLNVGKWLHNVGAFGMWVPAAIVIVMGFIGWHRFGSANQFTAASLVPSAHLKDMIFWASLAFAFGGCETASFMGEEVKNPRRNIPRALILAGLIVAVCYILGTVAVLLALPSAQISDLQGLIEAIRSTADRLGWIGVVPVAAALIAVSNLGAAGAFLAATARLPFVVGIDRYLPAAFGKLHPRWGTPYVALLTQSSCGVVFVLLGQAGTSVRGAYDVLVSMGIITYFIPYLFVFASMFRLQWENAGVDVIRVPGRKPVALLVSCLGFATTLLTIGLSLVPAPEEPNKILAAAKVVGLTAVLLAGGAILYYRAKSKNRIDPAGDIS